MLLITPDHPLHPDFLLSVGVCASLSHGLQLAKAQLFEDAPAAYEIGRSRNHVHARRYSRVRGYTPAVWKRARARLGYELLCLKHREHPFLDALLRASGSDPIVVTHGRLWTQENRWMARALAERRAALQAEAAHQVEEVIIDTDLLEAELLALVDGW